MKRSSFARSLAWFLGLTSALLTIACTTKNGVDDRPCPCAEGWTCCATTNSCVAAGAACATAAASPSGPAVSCAEAPLSDACLHDEATAIFVAPSGSDVLGTGTRDRPVKTLAHALTMLTPDRRRVYVAPGAGAAETFPSDALALDAKSAGLVLVGGLSASWQPDGSRTRLGGDDGYSARLEIRGPLDAPIVVDGFELTRGKRTLAVDPRYAELAPTIVIRQADVVFRNVRVTVADGLPGTDGAKIRSSVVESGSAFLPLPASGVHGGSQSCNRDGSVSSKGGEAGASGVPGTLLNGGNNGVACDAGGDGANGQSGADGLSAGAGATSPLALNPPEYAVHVDVTSGGNGDDGTPGQGGGGGGTGPGGAGNGGGGGAGGCPGRAGGGGLSGGSSVAIVVTYGKLTMRTSQIVSGAGGEGGKGGEGEPFGENPSYPGAAGANGGCKGGVGSKGGGGRPGGGGAGGSSIGVLAGGATVDVDDATRAASTQAAAGKGGGGLGASAGADGVSALTVSL